MTRHASPKFVNTLPTPIGGPAVRMAPTPVAGTGGIFVKWEGLPNVEIVLWQNRLRVAFASVIASVAAVLRLEGMLPGEAEAVVWPAIAYLLFIASIGAVVWSLRRAPTLVVALLIVADLAVIFAIGAAPPAFHSSRVLLLCFLVLVFAEFHFGRAATVVAIAGTVVGYSIVLWRASTAGGPVHWGEEIWMLVQWCCIGAIFAVLHGTFTRRLQRLVELFNRAQDGDFTLAYDDRADARPDAITMVGRAYNEFRSQLATMVLTDPLSGCFNRRGYQQHMQRALARSGRSGEPVALMLIDIDWFKSVNDTFGHLAGDAVIREIGMLLRHGRRAYDICARVGGEEFALLLPNVSAESAMAIGRRIRDSVANRRFASLGAARTITVSIGVAMTSVQDPAVSEDLHARADEALYQAKRSGRNRVVLWPGDPEGGPADLPVRGDVRVGGTPAIGRDESPRRRTPRDPGWFEPSQRGD